MADHPIDIAELRRLHEAANGDDPSSSFLAAEKLVEYVPTLLDRIEAEEWRPIDSAPIGKEVIVRTGEMSFRATLLPDASINEAGDSCDQWHATREGEHPPCWTDGACWESNETGAMSLQPDAWRPAPTTGGADA